MTGPISEEGLAQKVEDRTLLLTTGFDHGQDALDKAAAMLGLSAVRGAPPDHRMTQGAFGAVVGGVYWIAYRRRAGILRRVHLGKSDRLTLDRLEQVALALAPDGSG